MLKVWKVPVTVHFSPVTSIFQASLLLSKMTHQNVCANSEGVKWCGVGFLLTDLTGSSVCQHFDLVEEPFSSISVLVNTWLDLQSRLPALSLLTNSSSIQPHHS